MANLRCQLQWIKGCLETGEALFMEQFVMSQISVCDPENRLECLSLTWATTI